MKRTDVGALHRPIAVQRVLLALVMIASLMAGAIGLAPTASAASVNMIAGGEITRQPDSDAVDFPVRVDAIRWVSEPMLILVPVSPPVHANEVAHSLGDSAEVPAKRKQTLQRGSSLGFAVLGAGVLVLLGAVLNVLRRRKKTPE
ncbi:hypothetical protein MB46_07365 [Arthrobacter alpinus]|nr:hypothetical protein MB46_07365 [Arthrobacter alpinus]